MRIYSSFLINIFFVFALVIPIIGLPSAASEQQNVVNISSTDRPSFDLGDPNENGQSIGTAEHIVAKIIRNRPSSDHVAGNGQSIGPSIDELTSAADNFSSSTDLTMESINGEILGKDLKPNEKKNETFPPAVAAGNKGEIGINDSAILNKDAKANGTENKAFLLASAVNPDENGQFLEGEKNISSNSGSNAMELLHDKKVGNRRRRPLIFKAAENGEKQQIAFDPSKVAVDYLTGERLDSEEAKKRPLITMESDGYVIFQGWVDGASRAGEIAPVSAPARLHFKPIVDCNSTNEDHKKGKHIIQLLICKEDIAGKCDNGILICFAGQLDPKNRGESLDPKFTIENHDDPNFSQNLMLIGCHYALKNNDNLWDKKTKLHALKLKITDSGQIELTTSFSLEKKVLTPFEEDRCVAINIGTENEELITRFTSVEDNEEKSPVIPQQSQAEFLESLANGANLRDQEFTSILTLDMLSGFDQNTNFSLFFAALSKCSLNIKMRGQSLKKCLNEKCTYTLFDEPTEEEKLQVFYQKDFARMKPVNSPDDLPDHFVNAVQFVHKDGRVRAFIYAHGHWEVPFALLTDNMKQPPKITIVHPEDMEKCAAIADDFEANEMILTFNGGSYCYIRLGWDQTRMRMFDDDTKHAEYVNSTKDVHLQIGVAKDDCKKKECNGCRNFIDSCNLRKDATQCAENRNDVKCSWEDFICRDFEKSCKKTGNNDECNKRAECINDDIECVGIFDGCAKQDNEKRCNDMANDKCAWEAEWVEKDGKYLDEHCRLGKESCLRIDDPWDCTGRCIFHFINGTCVSVHSICKEWSMGYKAICEDLPMYQWDDGNKKCNGWA